MAACNSPEFRHVVQGLNYTWMCGLLNTDIELYGMLQSTDQEDYVLNPPQLQQPQLLPQLSQHHMQQPVQQVQHRAASGKAAGRSGRTAPEQVLSTRKPGAVHTPLAHQPGPCLSQGIAQTAPVLPGPSIALMHQGVTGPAPRPSHSKPGIEGNPEAQAQSAASAVANEFE
ncbi:hypothetical protein ABBQ32_008717 [Trebouxia sp. C0010 RCD-2024]